eukprot:jgi/Chlat1/8018/Chrsp7S07770
MGCCGSTERGVGSNREHRPSLALRRPASLSISRTLSLQGGRKSAAAAAAAAVVAGAASVTAGGSWEGRCAVHVPPLRAPLGPGPDWHTKALNAAPPELLDTLTSLRNRLASLASNADPTFGTWERGNEHYVEQNANDYLEVLLGLLSPFSMPDSAGSDLESSVSFSWNNWLSQEQVTEVPSAQYEVLSVLVLKACAKMMEADSLLCMGQGTMERKEGNAALLRAAGILEHCCTQLLPTMSVHTRAKLPADLSPKVLRALQLQCLAQVEELQQLAAHERESVTLKAQCWLACFIAHLWDEAVANLRAVKRVGPAAAKQDAFFNWKLVQARATAYFYHGLVLDEEDEKGSHGQAVACLRLAQLLLAQADNLRREYNHLRPHHSKLLVHNFVLAIRDRLPKDLEKMEKISTQIYYEREPVSAPNLPEAKLPIKLETYSLPKLDPVWTSSVYAAITGVPVADIDVKMKTMEGKAGRQHQRASILVEDALMDGSDHETRETYMSDDDAIHKH